MATQVSLNSGAVASAGTLALQTNGTTEAVSISTGQVATLAQNPILSSGTINSVQYLDSSKILTSDSNFVYTTTGLGIGTSSLTEKLNVVNSGSYAAIRVSNGTNSSLFGYANADGNYNTGAKAGDAIIRGAVGVSIEGNNGTSGMRLDSSGNLGLGVTPSAWSGYKAFEFVSAGSSVWSAGAGDVRLSSNTYYNGGYKFAATGVKAGMYNIDTAGVHSWNISTASGTAGNAITFTQAMTLDASGTWLLGTTTAPAGASSTNKYAVVKGSTEGVLVFGKSNTGGGAITGLAGAGTIFYTYTGTDGSESYTERARITSGGKLLVNTQSIAGTLTVDAVDAFIGGNPSSYAITCGNDANDALAFGSDATKSYVQSFGGRYLVINQQGNEVLVAGASDNGAYNLQCNGTGVWGAGAYVNGSDERIKDDIAPIASGLDVVTKLNPVTYRYKEDWSKDQSTQTGFIAQELLVALEGQNYVDGVVQQGGSEGYYSVAYQNIIPILTKAIQEQNQLIQSLTDRISALEGAKA